MSKKRDRSICSEALEGGPSPPNGRDEGSFREGRFFFRERWEGPELDLDSGHSLV